MNRDQLMSSKSKDNRLIHAKRLLSSLKYEESEMLWFFSDEKSFDRDQKVIRQKERCLCSDPNYIRTVMHINSPANAMVLEL